MLSFTAALVILAIVAYGMHRAYLRLQYNWMVRNGLVDPQENGYD